MREGNEELVQSVKKIVLGMSSEDKKVRKSTLIELQAFISQAELSSGDLRAVFVEIYIYTLNGFRDKAEIVREQAIKFMTYFLIQLLSVDDFYLTYVIPVLVERIGSVEFIEESEEIRLHALQLLQAIILKYSNTAQLKPFLGDCVLILCETVKDNFPTIKELSCVCVVDLAQALPRDFHMQAENLIKPTLTCFGHQRFKVRVQAINAIGEIIMHSSYKGLDEVIGPLAEKLFDQIPIVRRTVAQVAARWLLEYRDRYSFFQKIIPLLITGLNDEVEETRVEAQQLWDKVGKQYELENEKDLKDQIDFLLTLPKYYPSNLKRPNLGCRVLVQRNVGKMARALSLELQGWHEDIRFRCSQLLCSIALHAENNITHHLQELLPAMYSAAREQDQRVIENVVRASQLMGNFVPQESWFQLILPIIEGGPHPGHLRVLSGFVDGTPEEYITQNLEKITGILSDASICYTRKKVLQEELVKCVDTLLKKVTSRSGPEIGYHLFKILLAVISLRDPDNPHIDINLMIPLYKGLKLPELEDLWTAYTGRLLFELNHDTKSWTVTTAERCIFETILLHANTALGENLPIVAKILEETLHIDADAESRLKTFWALSETFDRKAIFTNSKNLSEFFEVLISGVFVPSLIWRAGLTAEAMRTMAISCLICALTPLDGVDLFKNDESFRSLCEKLLPQLLSLLEDASYRSRELAVDCCVLLKQHASCHNVWDEEMLLKIYPEIFKRLDDPTEKVRISALKAIPGLFTNVPNVFKELNFKAHHEFVIDALLTHFDDDEQLVRDLVFECFQVLSTLNANLLVSKITKHRPLICNKEGCDKILKYLEELKHC